MSLIYKTGDLFALAQKGSVLAHACNCHGTWGAGVALAFRRKYPNAYNIYHNHCISIPSSERSKLLGTCLLIEESDCLVACLFTSGRSGAFVDPPAEIVKNTKRAMDDLWRQLESRENVCRTVYMPMINAGLFRVPWEETEGALKESLKGDRKIVVCKL